MTNNSHDHPEFNTYLQGQSPLSKLYQQTMITGPTSEIDAKILAAAQASVTKRGGPVSPFSHSWMVPTSLAAVIILTVSIVLLSRDEQDSLVPLPESVVPASEKAEPPVKSLADNPLAKKAPLNKEQESLRLKQSPTVRDELKTERAAGKIIPQQSPTESPSVSSAVTAAPAAIDKEKPAIQGDANESDHRQRESSQTSTKAKSSGALRADADVEQKVLSTDKLQGKSDLGAANKSAEAWLQEITNLLKAGKDSLARDEFKAFRKTYANFVIDLKRFPEVGKLADTLEKNTPHK